MALIILAVGFGGSPSVEAETLVETTIAPAGETTIERNLGGTQAKAVITTHTLDIGKPSDQLPAIITTNCTYSRFPCSLVDRIDLYVNGKQVFTPRSIFTDLSDLNKAHLETLKDGAIVFVAGGGDASEGYGLRIEFNKANVLARKKWVGEFPETYEATTYVWDKNSDR